MAGSRSSLSMLPMFFGPELSGAAFTWRQILTHCFCRRLCRSQYSRAAQQPAYSAESIDHKCSLGPRLAAHKVWAQECR